MRALGLDWGAQRVGLAVADTVAPVAIPRGTEINDKGLVMKLAGFVLAEHVEQIVIGLPLTMAGEEGEMTKRVRAFGKVLAEATALPIAFVDERLSSRDTDSEAPQGRDAQAAATILQLWLDQRTRNDTKQKTKEHERE